MRSRDVPPMIPPASLTPCEAASHLHPPRGAEMFQACGDGILLVGQDDGRIAYANPVACDLLSPQGYALAGIAFGTPTDGSLVDVGIGGQQRVAEMRVTEVSVDDTPFWLVSLRDVTAHRERLRAAEAEAEVGLIRLHEVRHRIGNTFAMLEAMVRTRRRNLADAGGDAGQALRAVEHSVRAVGRSLAVLNDAGDQGGTDLGALLHQALGDLGTEAIRVRIDAASVTVPARAAQSALLIAHELALNAIKYAYPSGTGEVRVRLRDEPAGTVLIVEDDGIGFDPDAAPKGGGVGFRLNEALARTEQAVLTREPVAQGTRWSLALGRG